MRLLKSVLLVSSCLLSSVSAADSAAAPDEAEKFTVHYRKRMIAIQPFTPEMNIDRNVLGEVGDGATFKSVVPILVCVHDIKPTISLKTLIEAANESFETREVTSSTEKNKRYFNIIRKLSNYATKYLPKARDKKSLKESKERTIDDTRNALIVSMELIDERSEVLDELFLGIFVSGASTCKLKLGEQSVTQREVTKEIQKFAFHVFENSNSLVLRNLESLAPDFKSYDDARTRVKDWVTKEVQKHEVKVNGNVESYNIGAEFSFDDGVTKLNLFPVSIVELQELHASSKFRQLTRIFYGLECKDAASLARVIHAPEYRKAKRNRPEMVERVLDHPPFDKDHETEPDKPSDKGAFHSGGQDCFGDSEQAFLAFLECPSDRFIVRSKQQAVTNVKKVIIRLLSTRDICKFCRGTLSFSLSSDDSWLNGALNKFLELQKISMVQNFEVSIVGYSMCPTSKERR